MVERSLEIYSVIWACLEMIVSVNWKNKPPKYPTCSVFERTHSCIIAVSYMFICKKFSVCQNVQRRKHRCIPTTLRYQRLTLNRCTSFHAFFLVLKYIDTYRSVCDMCFLTCSFQTETLRKHCPSLSHLVSYWISPSHSCLRGGWQKRIEVWVLIINRAGRKK